MEIDSFMTGNLTLNRLYGPLTINFTLRSIEISPSLSQTFMLDASRAAEFIVAYHLDLRIAHAHNIRKRVGLPCSCSLYN